MSPSLPLLKYDPAPTKLILHGSIANPSSSDVRTYVRICVRVAAKLSKLRIIGNDEKRGGRRKLTN